MKRYFAYIRVSTVKQGEKGSSLQEQKAAIEAYARRQNLKIAEWFEELETAAKQGRPVFSKMLKAMDKGLAAGVITHKIDRSARNLRDWAALGDLLDRGIELHFAHESIDLTSRGGRLSADIQAVVAADFIRNLREETRKGFYGRLKQGLYPMRAPLGYVDQGRGMPKTIDPECGALIRSAFQLYATGKWSLDSIGQELYRRGLRNRAGGRVTRNGLSTIFNNTFYFGLMRIEKTREVFQGIHEPLISHHLFAEVQTVLTGRVPHRSRQQRFRYQRTVRCASCSYSLVAERQKGHVYYRCHTASCPTTSIREEEITETLRALAICFRFSDAEWLAVEKDVERVLAISRSDMSRERQTIALAITALDDRLNRLTDAYVDQVIDREAYLERKERLLTERASLTSRKSSLEAGTDEFGAYVKDNLELIKALGNMPDAEPEEEVRELLNRTTSNFAVDQKSLQISWASPFDMLAGTDAVPAGDPKRIKPRTGLRLRKLNTALRAAFNSKRFAVETREPEVRKPKAGRRALLKFNLERRRNKDGRMGDTGALAA